ncbi:zinc finger protein 436-like, partial [Frankliniella occidentalis]|uniref:Zinc finger protein 436-like n=1 Tax=Frankliniella occidentalis TaxID=133901 RepID=A0A9C6XVV9_FRAOC
MCMRVAVGRGRGQATWQPAGLTLLCLTGEAAEPCSDELQLLVVDTYSLRDVPPSEEAGKHDKLQVSGGAAREEAAGSEEERDEDEDAHPAHEEDGHGDHHESDPGFENSKVKKRHANCKCDVCGKTLSGSNSLKRHLMVHSGERPYPCNVCPKTFRRKHHLDAHVVSLHSGKKTYQCDKSRRSVRISNFARHQGVHTGERPFECKICKRRFSLNIQLNRHRRVHTGERPYECKTCKRRFARKMTLVSHMRLHTGERPYACNTCRKRFTQKCALVRHM